MKKELPRILYVSDVPVELSYAGATLIYRLLEFYPKEKLLIIQGISENKSKKINGVKYILTRARMIERLRHTRFSRMVKGLSVFNHHLKLGEHTAEIRAFKPEMILTVSSGLLWLKAHYLSRRLKIPLHLIMHDEWLMIEKYGKWQSYLSGRFAGMFKSAAARYCISQNMEQHYFDMYGIHSFLLYPFRGKNDNVLPVRISNNNAGLKFCYAGTLHTGDFLNMLDQLADIIGETGGELHIFSPNNRLLMGNYRNLEKPHVIFHGLVENARLIRILNEEMDVALLLNSFLHEEVFRFNFSSKLTDYTTAALPVLIWGAATSGAVSWALANGYELTATNQNINELRTLLKSLIDPIKRKAYAEKIKELGEEQFSYEKNYNIFIEEVTSGQSAQL